MGEVRGAPGWDIGMNTLPLGPTVTGLWMARGEMDGEKQPAGVVDLEELLRVTVKTKLCEGHIFHISYMMQLFTSSKDLVVGLMVHNFSLINILLY